MQRFYESEATSCRECEQKAMLIKELEQEKATLLKKCEQQDTLLKRFKEHITVSLEQFKRQQAAFLRGLEQEKAELPGFRPYEEWRYNPSEYSERMDKLMDKLNEERQRDREIMDQKVDQNPDLFAAALEEKRARQKLEQTLQMSGLLRFIVERAREDNIIQVSPEATIQEALDKLAQTPEFTTILQQEVQARGLDIIWVMRHFHHIDHELWEPTGFKGGPITVRETEFADYDRAVLVILLKVQSNWPDPLDWTEETLCKEGK